MSNSLDAYLVLSGILFAIGTFGFLARRNAISMLMSIELMLNAVNLAIVAFGAFVPGRCGAQASVIALMVMAVAAAEATVGLAIVIAIYRNKQDAARRRVRRDAPMSDADQIADPARSLVLPLAGFAAHRARRPAAGQAGALDPGARGRRGRGSSRWSSSSRR